MRAAKVVKRNVHISIDRYGPRVVTEDELKNAMNSFKFMSNLTGIQKTRQKLNVWRIFSEVQLLIIVIILVL